MAADVGGHVMRPQFLFDELHRGEDRPLRTAGAESRRPRRHGRDGGALWWAPTLEELLQSWSRQPESLQQVDRKVQQYLAYLQADAMAQSDAKEREIIAEFARTWETVRRVMVDATHE